MSEEVFDNEVYPGPTQRKFSIHVDDSRGIAFEATQGMTRKEFEEKNRQAVDDLFKPQDEIGSVFETREKKLEEKISNEKNEVKSTNNNGIDSRGLESIRQESSAQDKTIQHSSVGSNFGL
mgnify:CR=1 FL=1|jgi:hypothetical protein